MEFIDHIHELTATPKQKLVGGLGLNRATYYNWEMRLQYSRLNDTQPVGQNPYRLLDWEKRAIIDYYLKRIANGHIGYKRLCYEMLDKNLVAVSPSSVFRVLKKEGLLGRWAPIKQIGTAPDLPTGPNQKWHTDLMQLNIDGQIFYYQAVIDAYSRYIVAWDVHIDGTALNAGMVLQNAFDNSPAGIRPFIVSDNGPEFIGREFRQVIKENHGRRMRISAYHPQSNGIDERHHRSLREECLNGKAISSIIHAREIIKKWVDEYNNHRLHSAIKYMAPVVWHKGDPQKVLTVRKNRLNEAKKLRKLMNSQPLKRVGS